VQALQETTAHVSAPASVSAVLWCRAWGHGSSSAVSGVAEQLLLRCCLLAGAS
jgi:hypothetical protein